VSSRAVPVYLMKISEKKADIGTWEKQCYLAMDDKGC